MQRSGLAAWRSESEVDPGSHFARMREHRARRVRADRDPAMIIRIAFALVQDNTDFSGGA